MLVQSILLLLGASQLANGRIYTSDVTAQKILWENFKVEHKKSYETAAEEQMRFNLFLENIKIADQHHLEAGGMSTHGITLFMDQNFVRKLLIFNMLLLFFYIS